jgi:hypothetical protein
MKTQRGTWLDRLGASQQFFSVADDPESRPSWSMGGLAAGAVPEAVRSSHGYTAQFPSDRGKEPRAQRAGDFFRN